MRAAGDTSADASNSPANCDASATYCHGDDAL